MPIVSVFFGIIIRKFHREHSPPHFHASYQGFEALIVIADGNVLELRCHGWELRCHVQ